MTRHRLVRRIRRRSPEFAIAALLALVLGVPIMVLRAIFSRAI